MDGGPDLRWWTLDCVGNISSSEVLGGVSFSDAAAGTFGPGFPDGGVWMEYERIIAHDDGWGGIDFKGTRSGRGGLLDAFSVCQRSRGEFLDDLSLLAGRPLDEVVEAARAEGFVVAVVETDGVSEPRPNDHKRYRVNIAVVDGRLDRVVDAG